MGCSQTLQNHKLQTCEYPWITSDLEGVSPPNMFGCASDLQATDDLVDRGGQERTHELEDPVAHHFAPGPQRLKSWWLSAGGSKFFVPRIYKRQLVVGQKDQLHQKHNKIRMAQHAQHMTHVRFL